MVLEERNDRNHPGRRDIDTELILPYRKLLYVFWKTRDEILSVLVQACGLLFVLVRGVDDGGVKLAASYYLSISLFPCPKYYSYEVAEHAVNLVAHPGTLSLLF